MTEFTPKMVEAIAKAKADGWGVDRSDGAIADLTLMSVADAFFRDRNFLNPALAASVAVAALQYVWSDISFGDDDRDADLLSVPTRHAMAAAVHSLTELQRVVSETLQYVSNVDARLEELGAYDKGTS